MIFSDECRLEALMDVGRFVRRRPHERYSDDCIKQTVKHPPSLMIWSCISSEGPGPIYFVRGTMKQDQYKEVLEGTLMPYIRNLPYAHSEYMFMQDGAPCHTARSINNYFDNTNLCVLPWPGNSPDLNPIENCWALLKSKVYSRPNTTVDMLKKNIIDIWTTDPDILATIKKCIDSMPTRIKEVIKCKGSVTKY